MANPLILNDALPIELKVKELKNNTFNGIIPPLVIPKKNEPPLELAEITVDVDKNLNPVWLNVSVGWKSISGTTKVIFSILRQTGNSNFVEIFNVKAGSEYFSAEEYSNTSFLHVDVPPISSCCNFNKVKYKLTAIRDDTSTLKAAQVIGPITFLGVEFKKNQNVKIGEI